MIMTSWDLRPSESNYQMILLMILMMMIKRWSRMIQMRTQTTLLQCCPGSRVRPGLEWDTAAPVDTVWTQLCGSRSPEHTSSDQPRHLAVTQWSSPTILSRSRPTIQTIMNLFLFSSPVYSPGVVLFDKLLPWLVQSVIFRRCPFPPCDQRV